LCRQTNTASFGHVIRERRRALHLTQEKLAGQLRISAPYIGFLESGKRRPSDRVISKLAEVLGLDGAELILLAKPQLRTLISSSQESKASAWEELCSDGRLHEVHKISDQEMGLLSRVAGMGDVRSVLDFIHVLTVIRHALGR